MADRRLTVHKHFDPRGLSEEDESAMFLIMTKLECLIGFDPNQFGSLSTVLEELTLNTIYNILLPKTQRCYGNLGGRPRERCYPLERLWNRMWAPGGPPFVSRRYINLYRFPPHDFFNEVESSMERNYQYKARQQIMEKYPIFTKEIQSVDNFNFMLMLLLPIQLEKARLRCLLAKASGRGYVTEHVQGLKYFLDFDGKLEREDLICLMAAVGEQVTLRSRNGRSEDLFVASMTATGLVLVFPIRSHFTRTGNTSGRDGPRPSSFLWDARQTPVHARFSLSPMTYKVMETGVIDGVSACGEDWFGKRVVRMIGLPVVPMELINKVRDRVGLVHDGLSNKQLEVVVLGLVNALERGIYFCLGAAGTGKTLVLDEYLFQITRLHQEDCPGSALIYLGEPTNDAACRAAERLVEKGYPAEKLLLVQGELAYASGPRVRFVRSVRITEYEPDPNVQILIGTIQVLARIRLRTNRCVNVMLNPPLSIVLDEICSYTVMEAVSTMILSGQAGTHFVAGDPNQISPRWRSRTAGFMYGETTLVDAAMRKPGTFEVHCKYPTPTPRNGVVLTENHRATTALIDLVKPFYSGNVEVSSSTESNNLDAERLMRSLKGVRYIEGDQTFIWIDIDSPCQRDDLTDSWSNRGEARLVAQVTDAVTEVVTDKPLMLITGYTRQVTEIKSFFGLERKLMIGTIDEFQGKENKIVIASLVRSSSGDGEGSRSLGFLVSPERINTLLTRGKLLVIVVGSASHFGNAYCSYWDHLLSKASIRKVTP